jgi:hypothetical protein
MSRPGQLTRKIERIEQIRGRLFELFEYNPETGDFTRKVTVAHNAMKGFIAGCPAKNGYLRIRISGKYYYNHRLAWLYQFGEWPAGDVDHINGIRDDNCLSNLRCVSRSENLQNRSAKGAAKSGLMGAYFDKNTGRWYSKAQCIETGRQIGLGHYDTKEDAHEAYRAWKRENHTFQPELRQ